jgi:hypothetical protein
MSYLNRDYYEGFFAQWQAGGCMAEVSRQAWATGWSWADRGARQPSPRRAARWPGQVALSNQGWARPLECAQPGADCW